MLPRAGGGLASPNTPPAVAYYLDQASRAHSVGANSAAIAMYRAALEQMLYEQEFKSGMLAAKIAKVEEEKSLPTARKWIRDFDSEFLGVLKDLGNGAIHPNDGDIKKQDAFDKELIVNVEITLRELLYLVYEEPKKTADNKAALRKAADSVKK